MTSKSYWRRNGSSAISAYIDANVFIHPLIYGASRKAESAAKVLKLVEEGELTAYTSTLTWDEVVWVVRRTLGGPDSIEAGRKLLNFPNLRFVPASEEVVRSAQELVEEQDLAPRDAIHVASAMSRKATTIVSDDPDLNAVKGLRRENPESFLSKGHKTKEH